jgi:hypothetical protein
MLSWSFNLGHLINPDDFNTSLTRPEMYEISISSK